MNDSVHYDAIQRLLYFTSTIQRTQVANTLTTKYDLPFNADDLMKACDNVKKYKYHATILMCTTLTKNLRMFIAIIYALINNKMPDMWLMYLCFKPYAGADCVLGCNLSYSITTIQIWRDLYDCYEFDVSELILSNFLRNDLQTHIDSKVTYTKRAIK